MSTPPETPIITAAEACKLMPKTAAEHVEDIAANIQDAAKAGNGYTILRGGFWSDDAYTQTKKWRDACGILQKLGYSAEMHYVESQFVDIGTRITWKEKK